MPLAKNKAILSNDKTLDQILESLPIAVITFRRGILLYANKNFRNYIGPEVAPHLKPGLPLIDYVGLTHTVSEGSTLDNDLIDSEVTALLHKTDKDAWIQERLKLYSRDSTIEEYDGNAEWWRSVQKYYPEDDTYIGIRIDISDIKIAQEKAIKASKAKSEFLANMSHEIRTPMSGVFMAAQLLQKLLRNLNQPALSDLTEILVGSAKHLNATINDVLDISKIEAGEVNINLAENSLTESLREIKNFQDPVAKSLGIDLRLMIDANMPERLVHDSIRVRQCVTNLVSNALKFTASGSVGIAAKFDSQTHVVTIQVVDSGTGIALGEQAQIFDQFAQAKQDAATAYKGTGLGLPISRKLARLMGGDLTLKSELGEGSVFTLTFACEPNISMPETLMNIA